MSPNKTTDDAHEMLD